MTAQVADSNASLTTVVTRVVNQSVKKVWAGLLTPGGQAALLGEGAMLGSKGDTWKANDGTWGVTRTYHPMEEIRFSWHKDELAPKTWVDVTLTELGPEQTRVEIKHDHANVELDVAKLTTHWRKALASLEDAL